MQNYSMQYNPPYNPHNNSHYDPEHNPEHNLGQYTMTLTGKGQLTVVPDIAIIRLGVETTSDNLSVTQSENARLSQEVLQSLKQLGITDIKTFQYDINKIYEYENGKQIDKGYRVRNILEINMNNTKQVGTVIDTAVSNGANVVELINFAIANADKYYLDALNLAVMNAYEKAKSITDNLGFMVNPIAKHILENSTSAIPYRASLQKEGALATPIEVGTKQIEASVTVEYIY